MERQFQLMFDAFDFVDRKFHAGLQFVVLRISESDGRYLRERELPVFDDTFHRVAESRDQNRLHIIIHAAQRIFQIDPHN